MATLDFSELDRNPPGESFEALVRMIGERLGLIAQWSGRGSDGGRDLVFFETQKGPLAAGQISWLVNCKDKSNSGASVTEKDIGSVLDKIRQHKCTGFLLATTTTSSTALKEKLDSLDMSRGGDIYTKVWDRFELTKFILEERFADIFQQFFPVQYRKPKSLDEARRMIEAVLPRFVAGEIRQRLVSHKDRISLLTGASIWPHDADQMAIIDSIVNENLLYRNELIADKLCSLNFEPFLAVIDSLIRNFPSRARYALREIVTRSNNRDILFNSIEILREDDNFEFRDELEITKKYDSELIYDLYHEIVLDSISDIPVWESRMPLSAAEYDDVVELESVAIDDLLFEGGDFITFEGRVSLAVRGWSHDSERHGTGKEEFRYKFKGNVSGEGIDIDEVS